MRDLRLAMLSRRFWPGMGSAETIFAQLACGLADRGCRITVVTARRHPRWPAQIDYHGFPVVRAGPMPDGFWRRRQAAAAVDRWLRRHLDAVDLVYVLGLQEDAAVAVRAVAGGRPVVLAPLRSGRHGDCCWQVEWTGRRVIKKACLQADAFVAYSPTVRGELEAAGYSRCKIHELHLGTDAVPEAATGSHMAKTQSQARSDLADAGGMLFLPAGARLVVCTTRTGVDAGWQTLLAAWPMVLQSCTTARLWFVGEPACRGAVLNRIHELALDGRAQVLGAMDSVEAVLAAADLLVAPSPHGSHVAILEAMAAGRPTVAIDTALNRWLLAGGFLVPPDDPRALADAIVGILNSPALAAQLGTAAWQRATRDFSLAKMVDGHLTLFQSLRSIM